MTRITEFFTTPHVSGPSTTSITQRVMRILVHKVFHFVLAELLVVINLAVFNSFYRRVFKYL
jgi:hypothetical protein